MIRKGAHGDLAFMRSMLSHAYGWRVNQLNAEIPLARYVDNWGRAGDVALIAADGPNRVGAAWYRLFPADAPGYAFLDERTPELTIAVVPAKRGHGAGQELLDALLAQAREDGHAQVSLSVQSGSPAIAFYERNGFEQLREGSGAVSMRRTL